MPFCVYQRFFLSILSHNLVVTLNYSMCGSPSDPFFPRLGMYYYFFAEFYLSLFSYLMKILLFVVIVFIDICGKFCFMKKKRKRY